MTQFTSGTNIGGCSNLDIACICSSKNFLSGIACCLEGACDAADQATAVLYAQQICKTANVAVPNAVTCNSASSGLTSSTSSAALASSGSSSATSSSSVSVSITPVPSPTSASAASTTASATKNVGAQNLAGVGVGVAGGLAAALALL